MERISWHTHEYLHTEKNSDWYWIVGIVTVSLALIAIIFNNLILAILIVVASFTLSLFASKKPEIIEASVGPTGASLGQTFYPYANLESFWVETRDRHPRVILKSKKLLMPFIVLFLTDVNSEEVRRTLSSFLPEQEHIEPLMEKILIYLGF